MTISGESSTADILNNRRSISMELAKKFAPMDHSTRQRAPQAHTTGTSLHRVVHPGDRFSRRIFHPVRP
jgi:hypothetical protein